MWAGDVFTSDPFQTTDNVQFDTSHLKLSAGGAGWQMVQRIAISDFAAPQHPACLRTRLAKSSSHPYPLPEVLG